jgi:hypothetical protein
MIEMAERELNGKTYFEICAGVLGREADALDIVGGCTNPQINRVLLRADNLSPAFFDLSSGLACAALLKFSNYSLKVALVLAPAQIPEGRFAEFAGETRRNHEFRIWYDEDSALGWLLAD